LKEKQAIGNEDWGDYFRYRLWGRGIAGKKSGAINKREAMLIGVFLSLSQALIKDTLIFAAVGADLTFILLSHIALTVLVLLLLRFLMA